MEVCEEAGPEAFVRVRRKTVPALDVVYALKRQGRNLYGFGGKAYRDDGGLYICN